MQAIEGFCKVQKHRINLKTIIKRFVPHVVHKYQLGYTRTSFHETMLPVIEKWSVIHESRLPGGQFFLDICPRSMHELPNPDASIG